MDILLDKYYKTRTHISSTVAIIKTLHDQIRELKSELDKSINNENINKKVIDINNSINKLIDGTCELFDKYDDFAEDLFFNMSEEDKEELVQSIKSAGNNLKAIRKILKRVNSIVESAEYISNQDKAGISDLLDTVENKAEGEYYTFRSDLSNDYMDLVLGNE